MRSGPYVPVPTCRRCLYPATHPLGLVLDEEGICSGCRIHEEKDSLDWPARWAELEHLVAPYRSRVGNHDCVVPVTGAQDSWFIVHLVKERLGMNPLLVSHNKYFNTPLGIRNLARLRIRFNCDLILQNVNPVAVRKVTRVTLRHLGSVYWPCLAGHTAFPVQTAVRYGIPLVVWGANQGLEQVGMFSHLHDVEMTRRYRKEHDLLGVEAEDLPRLDDMLGDRDVAAFRYPDDDAIRRTGVRGIYLGNFVRWDPKRQQEEMARSHGYLGAAIARTFDTYDHGDCYVYGGVHDLLKWTRQGYGKVVDHASREIRHGRLNRDDALRLVWHHIGKEDPHLPLFLEWLGMTPSGLALVVDHHRNPSFWIEESAREWRYVPPDWERTSDASDGPLPLTDFQAASTLEHGGKHGYLTVGKGWPG